MENPRRIGDNGPMSESNEWYRNAWTLFAALLAAALLLGCAGPQNRPPQLTASADLRYPPEAKARGIEGNVVVRYDITETGEVVNAEVLFADPPGVFDAAALAVVRSFRFRPALSKGEAVRIAERTSTITFKLDDGAYAGY